MSIHLPIKTEKGPSKWSLLRNPILFQGWNKTSQYFEGWYYKIVDPDIPLAIAVIPGVSMVNKDDNHAFIQVIDGIKCTSQYHKYPIEAFKASNDRLNVSIGENQFSDEHLILDLPNLQCDLTSTAWTKLPKKWNRPGIMGWYSYIPTMQCYHGLGSMHHQWSGLMQINQRDKVLSNAMGYVEKDWGSSFPRSWIWSQCNTFDTEKNLSVFVSVAHIPWKKKFFIGFLGAIYWNGKIEIFATYTGAKRQTKLDEDSVTVTYSQGDKLLKVTAYRAQGADLRSPIEGEMRGKVNESIQATIDVEYKDGSNNLKTKGRYAGLEVAGPIEELLTS
jgi:hypothetical protein